MLTVLYIIFTIPCNKKYMALGRRKKFFILLPNFVFFFFCIIENSFAIASRFVTYSWFSKVGKPHAKKIFSQLFQTFFSSSFALENSKLQILYMSNVANIMWVQNGYCVWGRYTDDWLQTKTLYIRNWNIYSNMCMNDISLLYCNFLLIKCWIHSLFTTGMQKSLRTAKGKYKWFAFPEITVLCIHTENVLVLYDYSLDLFNPKFYHCIVCKRCISNHLVHKSFHRKEKLERW